MKLKCLTPGGGGFGAVLCSFSLALEISLGRLAGRIIGAGGHCLELMTYGTHELDLRRRCASGTRLRCG